MLYVGPDNSKDLKKRTSSLISAVLSLCCVVTDINTECSLSQTILIILYQTSYVPMTLLLELNYS